MATKRTRKPAAPVKRRRPRRQRDGAAMTYGTFLVGAAFSVWFNVEYMVTRTHHPLGLASAVLWPAMAVGCLAVMTHVRWPDGRGWAVVRYVGVGLVGLVGMTMSVIHTQAVLSRWTGDVVSSWAGPVVVDLAMIVCGIAVLVIRTPQRRSKPTAVRSRARKPAAKRATQQAPVSPVPVLASA
jgi:hypothetical protein